MDIVSKLPHDLRCKVATFLDIDARRILGVYGRIDPESFLSLCIPCVERGRRWWSVNLGPTVEGTRFPIYSITKYFGLHDTYTEVIHVDGSKRTADIYGNYNNSYALIGTSSV